MAKNTYNANGAIVWEGKSAIDGAPIMLVATGLASGSLNVKTGNLVQTWILRSDIAPIEAVNSGQDESICGDCVHRGVVVNGKVRDRSCYVTLYHAPRNIFETAKRGRYARIKRDKARALFAGRSVRLGAYGDPAAVPFKVWDMLLGKAKRGTGYTHRWKNCDPRFARYCMASADSTEEMESAKIRGYRTFRVGTAAESLVKGKEILCPASKEAGHKTSCAACLLCSGRRAGAKNIFIPVHGSAAIQNAANRRVHA